jgi:hypothetical protein
MIIDSHKSARLLTAGLYLCVFFLQTTIMLKIPDLILIGGNTRHVGKTTLACEIIRTFSVAQPIIACKVTSIYKNDTKHHGKHDLLSDKDHEISREPLASNRKDTAKMLLAGAAKSYYIQALDHAVEKVWALFTGMIPANHLLMCESRSLRRFVEPGLFIYLKSTRVKEEKPYSLWLEELADIVLTDPGHADLIRITGSILVSVPRQGFKTCWSLMGYNKDSKTGM